MRVFVAGATGAVGRPLVRALIAAGHSVVGLTHKPEKADLIRRMGAEPAVADGLDKSAMDAAIATARPDIITHQMTDLSGADDLRHFDRAFAGSNRLRTEGTDILLAIARKAGIKRVIAQSFCGWPYARNGSPVKTEADDLDPDPPAQMRSTLEAIRYVERNVTTSAQPEGIALRYGAFYGPGTGMLSNVMVDQIRRRRFPLIGGGGAWWSFVHVDDAAAATVKTIEHGKPGNIYNIVDDVPAEVCEWLPALAAMLGAKPPMHLPAWIGRLLGGEHMVAMMTQIRAGSNAKAKRELDWRPTHPSWRDGFAAIIQEMNAHRAAA